MKRDLFKELMEGIEAMREARIRPQTAPVSNDKEKELPTHRVVVTSLESPENGLIRGSENDPVR